MPNITNYDIDIKKIMDTTTTDFSEAICHGMIVSELAILVARELRCDEKFCNDIAMAGMLHDIGKLKLSEELHRERSEAMVVEKMKYVRMHAKFSRDILSAKDFNNDILSMIYHHHENYDGSGYPDNISGTDIPLGARIIRVCDVYAALISDRSYRKAFSEKVAVELMIDEARHFDIKVFLAFQRVIHSDEYEKVRKLTGKRTDDAAESFLRENYQLVVVDNDEIN